MSHGDKLPAFKAYDIRGRIPDQLDARLARDIGRAYAQVVGAKRVVVGHDVRQSSPQLVEALVGGLRDSGVSCQLLGLCGTEEVYFATAHLGADGGIMVTASHNPIDYNGMKLVREGARPISGDTGLGDIEQLVREGGLLDGPGERGTVEQVDVREAYVDQLLSYIDRPALQPLKVVVNSGNGCAGPVLDGLAEHLPFELVRVHHEPDGSFPNGIPNPLLPENRSATADAVRAHSAQLGVAWDGDFDRCFLFDERGEFIEGYYIVGLLAAQLLDKQPGAKVIYDPRLTWNTIDVVQARGGQPIQSKSGHAFIKERMRAEDAVYGGEMSAHHYFRDFFYCDSGMIPWLLVAEAISKRGPLSQLVDERIDRFPASGEINRRIDDPDGALEALEQRYAADAVRVDKTDGVSIELSDWRFNLRKSNTEPLIRLNVEARGDRALMQRKTDELLALLGELGARERA